MRELSTTGQPGQGLSLYCGDDERASSTVCMSVFPFLTNFSIEFSIRNQMAFLPPGIMIMMMIIKGIFFVSASFSPITINIFLLGKHIRQKKRKKEFEILIRKAER